MKRIITTIILACMGVLAFGQQSSVLRHRMEIARMYYLSLGNLGFGIDLIQIEFDPIFELFIPLGNTLTEAIAKMEEIKAFYKQPRRSTMELTGCFAALYPNSNIVTITATARRISPRAISSAFSVRLKCTRSSTRRRYNPFPAIIAGTQQFY